MYKRDWVKKIAKTLLPYVIFYRISVYAARLKMLTLKRMDFKNREGYADFNYTLFKSHKKEGVSAMLRVKNEEQKIYYCLKSIIDIFGEIVFVDNGSEDRTLEIVREFKRQEDREDKIKIYYYPFKIARVGPENSNTAEDSVHSLTYYYNWTLSQCSLKYVCKWDSDMVLNGKTKDQFRRFLQQIQKERKKCWHLYGQTVYRDLRGNYYLSKYEIDNEIRVFPYGLNPRFYKIRMCEAIKSFPPLPVETFEKISFYELKFVNEDEFSHWSTNDFRGDRKEKEWENFQLIKSNNIDSARFEKLPSSFGLLPPILYCNKR